MYDPDHTSDDPVWLRVLTSSMVDVSHSRMFDRLYGGSIRADLTWGEAAEIVRVWADAPALPESSADRTSMSQDLRRAAQQLTREAFDPAVRNAVDEFLAVLPERLEEVHLPPVASAAAEVTRVLNDHDGAGSVLRVLCELAESDSPIALLVFWCEQMCDVAALGGHNGAQILNRIRDVLRDNALSIAEELGEFDPADAGDLATQQAGLTIPERIDLCLDILTQPPSAGHVVVWLFFGNAREFMGVVEIGPVTFIDGHLWLSLMRDDRASDDGRIPDEVRNHPLYFQHLPEVEDDRFVLARVDLGHRLLSDAGQLAERNVRAIGQLSRFWGLSTWQLWRGHIVVVDGVPALSVGFFSPDPPDIDEHPERDGTSYVLEEIDKKLSSHLPIADPALAAFLDSIEQLNAARHSPDDLQLITAVRAAELLTQGTNRKWYDLLRETYRFAWPLWQFSDELREIAFRAVKDVSPINRDRFLELNRAIVNETSHLSWSINPREAVASFDELIDLLGDRWPHYRRLVTVRDLIRNPILLARVVESGADDFDVLIGRCRRLRNSIVHGGPEETRTLRTVVPLLMSVARTLVNDGLYAVMEEVPVANRIEHVRRYYERQAESLRNGHDVLETLLEPFPQSD